MDIIINRKDINLIQLQKMAFIYNALEDGWSVRKKNDLYIFRKDHESKKEVYLDTLTRAIPLLKRRNLQARCMHIPSSSSNASINTRHWQTSWRHCANVAGTSCKIILCIRAACVDRSTLARTRRRRRGC